MRLGGGGPLSATPWCVHAWPPWECGVRNPCNVTSMTARLYAQSSSRAQHGMRCRSRKAGGMLIDRVNSCWGAGSGLRAAGIWRSLASCVPPCAACALPVQAPPGPASRHAPRSTRRPRPRAAGSGGAETGSLPPQTPADRRCLGRKIFRIGHSGPPTQSKEDARKSRHPRTFEACHVQPGTHKKGRNKHVKASLR